MLLDSVLLCPVLTLFWEGREIQTEVFFMSSEESARLFSLAKGMVAGELAAARLIFDLNKPVASVIGHLEVCEQIAANERD